ncbi:MAG TPA: alpha/beta hydrolase [Paraburkholderia sp.]|nr:alpha/beta hydrolase [Paraburkholderia sp.]
MNLTVLDERDERAPNERPVREVAPAFLDIDANGDARVPLYACAEWHAPRSLATTALVLLHGRLRNADVYFDSAMRAVAAAGLAPDKTLALVPQFLATADIAAHGLGEDVLHWEWTSWMGGDEAIGPRSLSSFDVLDAILQQLTSRERFPALERVVVAGHSGGAQVVQRHAVVTRGEASLLSRGVRLRYVIANPSSYVYFDGVRPVLNGGFAAFDRRECPSFDDWKYGAQNPPRYVGGRSFAALEAAYAQRDVVYMLGEQDCDPRHPALDRSCAAMAQGPHRLARGRAYMRYLQSRQAKHLRHRLVEVPDAGHDGDAMFTSAQGIAALFGE